MAVLRLNDLIRLPISLIGLFIGTFLVGAFSLKEKPDYYSG